MITCIFLCKKRHEYFNLNRIYDKSKYRFVCIMSTENKNAISDSIKPFFDEIAIVPHISDNEIEPIIQNEIDIAKDNKQIRLLCLDELDILLAARMREKFNIPGGKVKDYQPFRNKITMKEILQKNKIRTPKFIAFQTIDSFRLEIIYETIFTFIGSIFIVKPISGASSLETAKIENYKQFLSWYNSINGIIQDYEAEEFIEGKLYHCDSFIKDGEIVFSEVSECLSTCLDYANGNASDGGIVLPANNRLRNEILEFNKKVIRVLCPPDGALHHELFVTSTKEIIFLEIAARPGGGEIVKNLEKNYGINLYEQTLRNKLGEETNFIHKKDLYHGWVYLLLPDGKVKKLHDPKLQSNFQITWKVNIGDKIFPSPTSVLRKEAALILFNHNDFSVIYNDFNYLRTFQSVETE